VLAGTFTLEEVALWVLGGMVGKGLHVLFRAVAPTVVRMMTGEDAHDPIGLPYQKAPLGACPYELLRCTS